jgi:putative addiction module killer protein
MYDIQNYLTTDGRDPYAQWLSGLADRQARARILVRVARMGAGNLGDCKPLSDGVWELRIDWGPGYRVYYAMAGKRLVLLLVGGDKRKQQADINTALAYWNDWQQRRRKAT